MTKAEIIKEVSKSTGIEVATVGTVVEGFMACPDFKNMVK